LSFISIHSAPLSFWAVAVIRNLLPLAMLGIAALITLRSYSRLCFTLFSLVYVTQDMIKKKELHEK